MAKETKLVYLVQGSSSEPYTVTFYLDPFSISCNCAAGENGIPCKHRISILKGSDPGIIEGDKSFLVKIAKMTKCTNLFKLLDSYDNAKKERINALKRADYAYKNYREAREDFSLKKLKTDKKTEKCREALEFAIDEGIEAEKTVNETLKSLQTVFIKPETYAGKKI